MGNQDCRDVIFLMGMMLEHPSASSQAASTIWTEPVQMIHSIP